MPGLGSLVKTVVGRFERCMSTRTAVMSFGDGNHGALGLPTSLMGLGVDAYEPTRVPSLPSDITAVTAGHYHSLAVTSQGQLWAWGRDLEAQLGRGGPSPRDSWNQPRRVTGLDRVNVCSAFASGVISAAIGDDGSLWVWGKSKCGQLGLGDQVVEAVVPSRVEALAGDGTLLSCGSNVYGQLGREKQDVGLLPVDISLRPMPIAAGLGHSLAICQVPSSDVMGGATGIITWGWNQTSQLGRGGPEIIPLGVEGLEGETPVSVSLYQEVMCIPLLSRLRGKFGFGVLVRMEGLG